MLKYLGLLMRWFWHQRQRVTWASLISSVLLLMVCIVARVYSADRAQYQIYTLETVPAKPVAIIFGAWVNNDGQLSSMLEDRVKMGATLYQSGKVQALLLTGDNHIDSYNEPEAMREYALTLGIPDTALVLDYAGFRTYDSCYRAHAIFKVDQAILVTQSFHLDRALLTCNALNVASVGVVADSVRLEGYARSNVWVSEVREFPSTAFALLDLLQGKQPTFLGEPLPIFRND